MRVLIANVTLAGRSGTETVVRDLALGLQQAGHMPMVYSPKLGEIASEIASAGIPVVSDVHELREAPDIVHGNHHVELVTALLRFRHARGVFVCHDRAAYWSSPPRMARILKYVAVDLHCLTRLTDDYGIPTEQTGVIYNAVDTARFGERSALPPRPLRAALFSHYAGQGTHLEPVRAACDEIGLPLDVFGDKCGNPCSAPERVLAGYDIVFAKARCALEAMAVGTAVVLCDAQGLGEMVTTENLPRLRPWNFGHRTLRHALDPAAIVREIQRYDAADARAVSRDIRLHANLSVGLRQYIDLYAQLLREPVPAAMSFERELDDYVRRSAERIDELTAELAEMRRPFRMEPLSNAVASRTSLRVSSAPADVAPGTCFTVAVVVRNGGDAALGSFPPFPVRLASRWINTHTGQATNGEQPRTALRPLLQPGESNRYDVDVISPGVPGSFRLRITLVQERVLWFDRLDPSVADEVVVTVR
jgi:Glycosyltransferase Family 4